MRGEGGRRIGERLPAHATTCRPIATRFAEQRASGEAWSSVEEFVLALCDPGCRPPQLSASVGWLVVSAAMRYGATITARQESLAGLVGIASRNTVRNHLRTACEAGVLVKTHDGGASAGSDNYRLGLAAEWALPTSGAGDCVNEPLEDPPERVVHGDDDPWPMDPLAAVFARAQSGAATSNPARPVRSGFGLG